MKVTHELHERRKSRNMGVGLVLAGLIAIVFGLTVVKVRSGFSIEGFDHVVRPGLAEQSE